MRLTSQQCKYCHVQLRFHNKDHMVNEVLKNLNDYKKLFELSVCLFFLFVQTLPHRKCKHHQRNIYTLIV